MAFFKLSHKTVRKSDSIASGNMLVNPASSLLTGRGWRVIGERGVAYGGGKHKSRILAVYYVFNANISFTFQVLGRFVNFLVFF